MTLSDDTWLRVDDFVESLFPPRPELERVLESAERADLPTIHVSPVLGRFLSLIARSIRAESILEIGTLAGYSAIWLAETLPAHGRLVTLEADPAHAAVARANLAATGLADRTTVVEGPALETLPTVHTENTGGFDLVFIDADKEGYPDYWAWALAVSHPGTVIVADNVVRDGRVADPEDQDPRVQGVRQYLELATSESRVETAVFQTVGAKGHDGLSLSVVLAERA